MSDPAVDPAFKVIPKGAECFFIWRIEVRYLIIFPERNKFKVISLKKTNEIMCCFL